MAQGGVMPTSGSTPVRPLVRKRAGLRLSHHQHTGRRLPFEHTSYALLFFLLTLVGSVLLFATQSLVQAGPPQVQNGAIAVAGTVPGPPPNIAATINQPTPNQIFETSIVTVSGSCQAGYIVELYRNNAFAGSALCDSGTFSLLITLVPGNNELLARTKDSLDQYGPDSSVVTVRFIKKTPDSRQTNNGQSGGASGSAAPQSSSRPTRAPLLLYTSPLQKGIEPETILRLAYEIDGGQSPYAVSINWGDKSEATVVPHSRSGNYAQEHTYQQPGQFTIVIQAHDNLGNTATIQTIAVVNGPVIDGGASGILSPFTTAQCQMNHSASLSCQLISSLDKIWPAFMIALVMTLSFLCGEKVVYWRLSRTTPRVAK